MHLPQRSCESKEVGQTLTFANIVIDPRPSGNFTGKLRMESGIGEGIAHEKEFCAQQKPQFSWHSPSNVENNEGCA